MSRSSKVQRVKQKDRASVATAEGGAAPEETCADVSAADVVLDDRDDDEGVLDSAADDKLEARSSSDTDSDVCTRSDRASHIIRSDSNSKYAQDCAWRPAFLSSGVLNLMLGGKL